MTRKRILILGSTGSIGTQVLDCLRKANNSEFKIVGLVTKSSRKKVEEQQKEFSAPTILVTYEVHDAAAKIKELVDDADVVVNALAGLAGVEPTRMAIEAGKTILLANKESLVTAGVEFMERAAQTSARILPLDSEAAGLWALLRCTHPEHVGGVVPSVCPEKIAGIKSFIITASGGPFWRFSDEQLSRVTIEDALNHPTWKMGKKISVDSATLMNKAFEVIECQRLFQIPAEKISVLVDRKSFVHAAVQYENGAYDLVCYKPDMRVPITDALLAIGIGSGSNFQIHAGVQNVTPFNLQPTLTEAVPALTLAYQALNGGDRSCRSLCEKNETAVEQFLSGTIPFTNIIKSIT